MNRILGIVGLVLLLTVSGIIAMLVHERNDMARQLADSQDTKNRLKSEADALRGERDQLRKQLLQQRQSAAEAVAENVARQAASAATSSGKPTVAAAGGKGGGPAPTSSKPGSPLLEMMKNPAMKDMMKQQQVMALDSQYGKLFAKFNFSDAEKAEFKQLLGDRLTAEAELGLKMMEDLTPEQRKALTKEYEDAHKTSDARIHDFLNSENDYNLFKNWEDTKGERMQLDLGRSLFDTAGEPLSAQQEDLLIQVMHQVRMQPSPVPDLSKPQNFDPSHLSQADIDQQLAHYDSSSQSIANQAAQFLSPKQLETLRTMQQQWRGFAESSLKMTSMMFQSQGQGTAK